MDLQLSSSLSSGTDKSERQQQNRCDSVRRRESRSPTRSRSHSRTSSSSSSCSPTPASSVSDEDKGRGNVAPAAPPDLEVAVSKIRVNLTDTELRKHRGFAKGSAANSRDRETWLESLPVINDISGAAPRLDKNVRGRDMKINVSERKIIQMHSDLFAALNLITLSNVGNIRGTIEEVNYRDRAQRIISLLIQDVTVIRRESALASIGLPISTIPGIRKRALDLVEQKNPSVDNENVHSLFAADMMKDIGNAIKKKEKEMKYDASRRSDNPTSIKKRSYGNEYGGGSSQRRSRKDDKKDSKRFRKN